MRGIVADANIEGHVERLVDHVLGSSWVDFWNHRGIAHQEFRNIGLTDRSPDNAVWRKCRQEQLVLITANRNNDGPDSLEAATRSENTPDSLPVMTPADPDRIPNGGDYAERVVARLIEYLLDIDLYRGTGWLYLP